MIAGSSSIPPPPILQELTDDELRNEFVADQVRIRLALLIRTLREQRGWSQAELGRRLGKPQSVISRLEDPDYGKLTAQTLFEIAAAFRLPLYIDMPSWGEWFGLMADMSSSALRREPFDLVSLVSLQQKGAVAALPSVAAVQSQMGWGNPTPHSSNESVFPAALFGVNSTEGAESTHIAIRGVARKVSIYRPVEQRWTFARAEPEAYGAPKVETEIPTLKLQQQLPTGLRGQP